MYDFTARFKQVVDESGLLHNQIAEAADTTEATISRYYNGTNKSPRINILVNIAKALNVSTDYLLGASDVPYVKNNFGAEEKILLSAFRKASERDVAVIWQLLDHYLTPNERGFLQQSAQIESQSKIG